MTYVPWKNQTCVPLSGNLQSKGRDHRPSVPSKSYEKPSLVRGPRDGRVRYGEIQSADDGGINL